MIHGPHWRRKTDCRMVISLCFLYDELINIDGLAPIGAMLPLLVGFRRGIILPNVCGMIVIHTLDWLGNSVNFTSIVSHETRTFELCSSVSVKKNSGIAVHNSGFLWISHERSTSLLVESALSLAPSRLFLGCLYRAPGDVHQSPAQWVSLFFFGNLWWPLKKNFSTENHHFLRGRSSRHHPTQFIMASGSICQVTSG